MSWGHRKLRGPISPCSHPVVAGRLTEHDLRFLAGFGNAVPGQDPSVAGVSHQEPVDGTGWRLVTKVGQPERPIKGCGTAPAALVLIDRRRVGLSDDHIGSDVARLGHRVPDEEAVVPGVGHHEAFVDHDHPGREPHPGRRSSTSGLRPFGGEVGLTEHHVGRAMVAGIGVVPDEDPVVSGVGHDETLIVEPHPSGSVEL